MGDAHKLQLSGPCVIRHLACGLMTDHAQTTSLELVWMSHGRLVLIIILVDEKWISFHQYLRYCDQSVAIVSSTVQPVYNDPTC